MNCWLSKWQWWQNDQDYTACVACEDASVNQLAFAAVDGKAELGAHFIPRELFSPVSEEEAVSHHMGLEVERGSSSGLVQFGFRISL